MTPPERRHGGEKEEEAEQPPSIADGAPRPRPGPALPPLPLPRRKRFVLFGDSITQQSFAQGGWGALLADAYARKADVVLRGYSGYNTEWALSLVPEVFLSDGPSGGTQRRPNALVTVFFGANDAALADGASARQHVPAERFKGNLAAIARAALETVEPGGLVLLVSCPPVVEEQRARRLAEAAAADLAAAGAPPPPKPPLPPLPERTNEAARLYSRAAAEVAESFSEAAAAAEAAAGAVTAAAKAATEPPSPPRVAFLDLWEELAGSASPVAAAQQPGSSFLSDGLHLSEEGNLRVASSVLAAIAEHRPHLRAEELPLDFPDWTCSALEPCPR